MKRRDLFSNSGAVLLATAGGAVFAQDANHAHHAAHHAHMHDAPKAGLIAAAADCSAKGQVCVAHCLVLLADGDKAMAACAQSVSQVIALCNALESLAAQQAPLLAALAKVTLDACQACEKECRKHEKHEQCKACAESCVACIKECKALLA